jgi:cytochrome b561
MTADAAPKVAPVSAVDRSGPHAQESQAVAPNEPNHQRYDKTSIILHWLVAALVAALWIGAETLDWFPAGSTRLDARSAHILLGTVLGMVGGVRFVWRLSFGEPPSPANAGAMGMASRITHAGLYALLAAMVLAGMLLLWATGDSAFNHFAMPVLDTAGRAQADQLRHIHGVIGWIILATVGLHIAAVLFHRYVLHDDVLDRMLPRRSEDRC